ncbi:HlyD family efflux transporter periplasmic adaptor subunit [Roseovarius sp. PS-C2]|uniref:HlyD family efflux transporter periplasmic adaptor subunit n=1 Tax=Roseovarius sp. PS-C2 TaxID=2820814 RepID=UPI001C0D55B1|nr:HlyD family secretion protein [Roseovarius sp. PS-C2]MBU3261928.1 HlyD family efflux transporter periplasmic adaptor subunit [Roseovarius sp. PS-C2]
MRYLRLCIGFFLLFGALYVIVVEQMTGASSNAFINAPLLTARAPVAGDVALPDRVPGAVIKKGTTLFSVEDARADRVRLDDLRLERDLLAADLERHEAERDARQDALRWIESTADKYAAGRTRELEVVAGVPSSGPNTPSRSASEANTGLVEENKLAPDEDNLGRFLELSGAFLDGAAGNFDDIETLQLQAARNAVFLDDSAGAAWNMALRQREVATSLALVEADIARTQDQLAAYETRIERELSSLVSLRGDTLASPIDGVLWQELTANGVNVQRGDPIMNIADCASVLVTLSVSETIYNSLSTGDAATFRPLGGDRVMQGTVARLAGSGAASVYAGMAVAPSEEHLQRYDVALVVPELRASPAEGCSIGRTGRVFFDDRPLDILWKFWE